MARPSKITILTGAGLSAESGLSTFRDEGGLWAQHRIEDVATPEAFARNPTLVQGFYDQRRAQARDALPNAAHKALAHLQKSYAGEVVLITQNVDDLLEKAGASAIHMHGELMSALCFHCENRWPAPDRISDQTPCPACGANAARPDIVWFGEIPYHMETIQQHLEETELFASIGTSGQVYPAAGFVMHAREVGAETVELNLEPSDLSRTFHTRHIGPATQTVPSWVEHLLSL